MSGTTLYSPLATGSALLPLEARLENLLLATSPRGCLVTIRNATVEDRSATIVAAGALFYFYDPPLLSTAPMGNGDYMAGPVPVEIPPGVTAPFRFSDPRRFVYKVAVGVRVLFGNAFGFPPASYGNYFWELTLPPLPPVQPPPLHPQLGEVHLEFKMKREAPTPTKAPVPTPVSPATSGWPQIPGLAKLPAGESHWFELAERPR
jgi:hypothetical protein